MLLLVSSHQFELPGKGFEFTPGGGVQLNADVVVV